MNDATWDDLRRRVASLGPDELLVTPVTDRAFVVTANESDRLVVEYRASGAERTLRRDQFAFLVDQLDGDGLDVDDLASGVEPYVSVLSLTDRFDVDESRGRLVAVEPGEAGASPYLTDSWAVRAAPERLRDDTLLLFSALDRYGVDGDADARDTDALVDLYVLLSDVAWGADDVRKETGDALLDRIGPDDRLHGRFGSVRRVRRERRRVKDAEEVFAALDAEGIPREWVLGVDTDKLDVALAVTGLEEGQVYDVDEQVYVQKTDVDEEAKRSRLQGIADRIAELDDEAAEELWAELDAIEGRLDELAAGD